MRKPISYKYNKEGRANGIRYGNPHAVFLSSANNINIDIWKTSGVRSDDKPIPDWKVYTIKHMEEITILEDQPDFPITDGYKPNSPKYERAFAKV